MIQTASHREVKDRTKIMVSENWPCQDQTFDPPPQVFEETVEVCNEPLVKNCANGTLGEEVCTTHYETNCETRFFTFSIYFRSY
jgi:hypothetical protein